MSEHSQLNPDSQLTTSRKTINLVTDALVVLSLVGFSVVSWFLQLNICTSCISSPISCSLQMVKDCTFFVSERNLTLLLILTHSIPYVLIPLTMRIVYIRTKHLQDQTNKRMNPFVLQLGLATICMALAFEFGWHVSTIWYYRNDFHILNFVFYFFLISSFALWADGFYSNNNMDIIFVVLLAISTVLYAIGASKDESNYKIPLYIALTVVFVVLTIRGMIVLGDRRMLWVPFFCVVVNLFFAFKLQALDPTVLSRENYAYHIAHDLLGTELGVAVFAYLVWVNPRIPRV